MAIDVNDGIEALVEHLTLHPGLLDRLELPDAVRSSVEVVLDDRRSNATRLAREVLDQIWDRVRRETPADEATADDGKGQG